MKKVLLALTLAFILTAGSAFAEDPRPDKFGIGVVGRYGGSWYSGSIAYPGLALSLKIPNLPVYWGIDADLHDGWFGTGVTADFWNIVGVEINPVFGWYLDFGLYAGLGVGENILNIDFGVRLPIGFTIQPLDFLEVFIAWAPRFGLGIRVRDGNNNDKIYFGGGWPIEIGVRFWL